ncbi:DUF4013 domain-containing protein [Methanobrevibacter filiformis]|uniref:Glycerophosphoryl diester phosphodiesterase membrane domain-containing protein n=1 Tax=Methanobrevibacter filiformis TaxID=55758 RepID=A0A166BQN8_9EURY|nr:DUF4013 domain-containing protein [Methanobrevibacter filiformis]KZX13688.1 hypothetical protein MBFIL_09840 [Methanobrevibacter filiformis]
MSLSSILDDGFKYPFQNKRIFIVIGILALLYPLLTIIVTITGNSLSVEIIAILIIVGIITYLILMGYGISIIKSTINNDSKLPTIELKENILNGIKYLSIILTYFIIPIIIMVILISNLNFIQDYNSIMGYYTQYGLEYGAHTPNALLINFLTKFLEIIVVGIILLVIFLIPLLIGFCRLSKDNSVKSALQITEIIKDIKEIGWGRYIGYLIAIGIIVGIIMFFVNIIIGYMSLMGILGLIISTILNSFIIVTFFGLFISRVLGLVYNLKDEEIDPYINYKPPENSY